MCTRIVFGKFYGALILGLLSFFCAGNIALAQSSEGVASRNRETVSEAANRFGQTMYYLDNYYLDTVDFKGMIDAAIVAALQELDPHSSYVRAEDLMEVSEPLEASFEGIGIEFAIIRDTLTVQGVIQGGPSQKVGLTAGDKILYIDGDLVAGVSLKNSDVRKYLRGQKGSKVVIKVQRRGIRNLLHFVITRDVVPIHSLDAAYECDPGVLYLKLSRFAVTSYHEVHAALEKFLKSSDPKGVILDLRGNGGGYLSAAIDIANEFLPRESLIVSTEGRAVSPVYEYANGYGIYTQGPLCVLIDENSASASEIVSGALQDHDRAVIIGRRSFGKGLVQRALPLSDGSQLRLTIARYHTPSGRVIQSPYEMGDKKGYYENFYRRYADGELYNQDSVHLQNLPVYQTLKRHRTVYGGGGIMPDIFIPADTSSYSGYFNALLREGVIIEFVNRTVDKMRRNWLERYPSFEDFNASGSVDDVLLGELVKYAEEKSVPLVEKELEHSRAHILSYMKALICSSLYSHECFYRVMNAYEDPLYDEGRRVLREWSVEYEKIMTKDMNDKF